MEAKNTSAVMVATIATFPVIVALVANLFKAKGV